MLNVRSPHLHYLRCGALPCDWRLNLTMYICGSQLLAMSACEQDFGVFWICTFWTRPLVHKSQTIIHIYKLSNKYLWTTEDTHLAGWIWNRNACVFVTVDMWIVLWKVLMPKCVGLELSSLMKFSFSLKNYQHFINIFIYDKEKVLILFNIISYKEQVPSFTCPKKLISSWLQSFYVWPKN